MLPLAGPVNNSGSSSFFDIPPPAETEGGSLVQKSLRPLGTTTIHPSIFRTHQEKGLVKYLAWVPIASCVTVKMFPARSVRPCQAHSTPFESRNTAVLASCQSCSTKKQLEESGANKSFAELVDLGRREHWIVEPTQLCCLETNKFPICSLKARKR